MRFNPGNHSSNSLPARIAARAGGAPGRLWRDEAGATAIVTALALTVLVGFTGLGVEVGSWYLERRALQTAADAAALGAGYRIYKAGADDQGAPNANETEITTAAETEASRNGYTDGVEGVDLTVNSPPASGPNAENEFAAEAIIAQPKNTLLASLFTSGDVTVRTRAVAVVRATDPFCVLALDPTIGSALKFGGTTNINLENCGLIANSTSDTAMSLIGTSVVGATYADVTGNYSKSQNSTLDLEEGQPNTGVDPLPDPFKDLNIPSGAGCGFGTPPKYQVNNNQTVTINPGRYCGGIKVNGTGRLTMNPGNYVMVGGGFEVSAQGTVTGTGVTIFLTGSGSDYAQVTINGGATVSISAPTSGDYQGIAFFQDRAAPVVNVGAPNKFVGNATMEIKGAIYIPNQQVQFAGGNNAAGGCTRIVARTIEFTGTSDIDSDCTGFGFGAKTLRPPTLME